MGPSDVPRRAARTDWAALGRVLGGEVVAVRRRRGGLDALTHAFDLVTPGGGRERLVLRRFTASWNLPGDAAAHAAVLRALDVAGAPAPRLRWFDGGDLFGVEALVMTRLPGRPIVEPDAVDGWLSGLAGALASVHRVGGRALAPLHDDGGLIRSWIDEQAPQRARGARGRLVLDALSASAPPALRGPSPDRLVHRDFHAGNVLFHRGSVSGVVDWGAAARGWPARDVGYCRLDLALMAGGTAPDGFLAAYEAATGARVANLAFWDLFGAAHAMPDPAVWLPSWLEWGRTDLTPTLLRRRLTAFVHRAVAAL